MASARRLSNGRSPLVRKQSQITAFFSSPESPNPRPDPSPSQPNPKKPPLAIAAPPPPKPPAAEKPEADAVGKRLRVYWPLDDMWYGGRVEAYDEASGRHSVRYDDGEEEEVELAQERVEWAPDDSPQPPRKLRRLRRLSAAAPPAEETGDSTDDEDWKAEVAAMDDDSEEAELDEEAEEKEQVVAVQSKRGRSRSSSSASASTPASGSALSRKRKKVDVCKLDCAKKFSFDADKVAGDVKSVPVSCDRREPVLDNVHTTLAGEAAERFGQREVEKFRFLREGRKDAEGRRPGDPGYNPRTLLLPPQFLKNLTGGQRQWWEYKSQHMDKVLFFKMGTFYELFEMDAHVGARDLDLQYMKGEQPHCGFPEKNLSINLEKLAKKGYRVLVVEQTETPEQLELRRKEMGVKDKVVRREICAIVTKGTLTEGESLLTNPDASYLMSVAESYQSCPNNSKEDPVIGICIVDVSTSKFILGQFEDDSERHGLCSILSELRPVEIIKPAKMLSPQTERVLKNNTRDPLINDLIPSTEFWDAEKTIGELEKYYNFLENLVISQKGAIFSDMHNNSNTLPCLLHELISAGNKTYALSALGGSLFYLRQAFLDENLLRCAEFESLTCMGFIKNIQKHMILDAAALENLEILENTGTGGSFGTLYAQLDHCLTGFGKRLLKRWIARPLYDRKSILERQDVIATFKGVGNASALQFRKELLRLPDMERLLARLFSGWDANGKNAKTVVLYEDAAKRQVQQFTAALRGCWRMFQACSSFRTSTGIEGSTLLNHLLTPGKGLPDVSSILDHFKDAFDWSKADRNGRIIPHEGCDAEYDAACFAIKEIESSLMKYLKEQRKLLGDTSINYVRVGKDIYLIEVPESLRGSVPRNYQLQSSKKGYIRYWTQQVKQLLSELSQAEAEKETKLKGIFQRLIQPFAEHHTKWRQLISVVAELDVLISLAIASDYFEGPTCRPTIKESCGADDTPILSARNLGHPVLRTDALAKGSFVPNDVKIGGPGSASFIVLTGPNMGGKSTLLRQVCLAVILAQIGADVPAENFELSLVDCIFVRMGARDHIMAGQSTFLVELMETASMLSSATKNSLVALDELGRGTSTSDGQAIAASVLEYLVHNVQCRGLFSTHYHRLAVEYEKDDKVSLCHMACQVGKGKEGLEEVTFLYRLTPGSCPKSYGVNVARLAGIPASVLQKANKKSIDFESNYGKRHFGPKDRLYYAPMEDRLTVIKDLFHVVKTWRHHEDQATTVTMFCEVQQRAKLQAMRGSNEARQQVGLMDQDSGEIGI